MANIQIKTGDKFSEKIIYPDLSYKIIGAAFQVFNTCGYGRSENFYQKAFAKELELVGIKFVREKKVVSEYKGEQIGRYFLDFDIENKVSAELKARPKLGYAHIKQIVDYLKSTGYKLAILIHFTRDGVKYRRILNSYIR